MKDLDFRGLHLIPAGEMVKASARQLRFMMITALLF
jgi:hypothetical protein